MFTSIEALSMLRKVFCVSSLLNNVVVKCEIATTFMYFLTFISIRLGLVTKLYTINPKDRSVVELYGVLDPNTRDWTDGLLSNIFRDINRPTDRNERKYIVYDGDVDALWVENMNSVMDDNRLLTLANGERIRLQKHCAMLFEVCSAGNTAIMLFEGYY